MGSFIYANQDPVGMTDPTGMIGVNSVAVGGFGFSGVAIGPIRQLLRPRFITLNPVVARLAYSEAEAWAQLETARRIFLKADVSLWWPQVEFDFDLDDEPRSERAVDLVLRERYARDKSAIPVVFVDHFPYRLGIEGAAIFQNDARGAMVGRKANFVQGTFVGGDKPVSNEALAHELGHAIGDLDDFTGGVMNYPPGRDLTEQQIRKLRRNARR